VAQLVAEREVVGVLVEANSPYTQLFLTHINDDGESSPPVVLEHMTNPDRAANIRSS
jgi:hypothetical protein